MSQQFDQYAEISYREGTDRPTDPGEQRALWKWEAAIGYRMFAALRWGQLGDGHITFRDPERRDHFWMLSYGVPFRAATIHDLILIAPDGTVAEGPAHATANTAGYNIHKPLLEVRQDINSAAHPYCVRDAMVGKCRTVPGDQSGVVLLRLQPGDLRGRRPRGRLDRWWLSHR